MYHLFSCTEFSNVSMLNVLSFPLLGLPHRMRYRAFCTRYGFLLPYTKRKAKDPRAGENWQQKCKVCTTGIPRTDSARAATACVRHMQTEHILMWWWFYIFKINLPVSLKHFHLSQSIGMGHNVGKSIQWFAKGNRLSILVAIHLFYSSCHPHELACKRIF